MTYTITSESDTSVTLESPSYIEFRTQRTIVNYVFNDNTDIQEDEGKQVDQIVIHGNTWSNYDSNMNTLNTIMDAEEEITVTGLSDSNLNTDYRICDLSFTQKAGWMNRYNYSIILERLQDRLG